MWSFEQKRVGALLLLHAPSSFLLLLLIPPPAHSSSSFLSRSPAHRVLVQRLRRAPLAPRVQDHHPGPLEPEPHRPAVGDLAAAGLDRGLHLRRGPVDVVRQRLDDEARAAPGAIGLVQHLRKVRAAGPGLLAGLPEVAVDDLPRQRGGLGRRQGRAELRVRGRVGAPLPRAREDELPQLAVQLGLFHVLRPLSSGDLCASAAADDGRGVEEGEGGRRRGRRRRQRGRRRQREELGDSSRIPPQQLCGGASN